MYLKDSAFIAEMAFSDACKQVKEAEYNPVERKNFLAMFGEIVTTLVINGGAEVISHLTEEGKTHEDIFRWLDLAAISTFIQISLCKSEEVKGMQSVQAFMQAVREKGQYTRAEHTSLYFNVLDELSQNQDLLGTVWRDMSLNVSPEKAADNIRAFREHFNIS